MVTKSQTSIKNRFNCCLQPHWKELVDQGNDQLATLRYDLKRLTSLTSDRILR